MLPAYLLIAAMAAAQPFFPVSEVRPGMRGEGRTVFEGNRIEAFQAEILGVLENIGPRQSLVLARLSGGALDRTGLLQGMSGSPVYVDGRLLGAVAMSFPFSKEPVAGIRPIEEMLRPETAVTVAGLPARATLHAHAVTAGFAPRGSFESAGTRLQDIATPLSFGGFTQRTIEQFAGQLRRIGLEPLQGVSSGGELGAAMAARELVQPGAMISVQLLSGDMNVGADGTVTHVEGDRVYAFGHRFLAVGETELPFARAEVITLLPSLSTSFKISAAREWAGVITRDTSAAVSGHVGRQATLVPVTISVEGPAGAPGSGGRMVYRMQMVRDRFLSPLLLQMATFSAIDATERMLGAGSLTLSGRLAFEGGAEPVRLDNMYAGEGNVPMQASLGAAVPLAYVLQSGFEGLRLSGVELNLRTFNEKRLWRIDQAWPSRRTARPGEALELTVVLTGDNGVERVHRTNYTVPPGAPSGTLNFTVTDGPAANLSDVQHLVHGPARSAGQVVSLVNSLRSSTAVYVRVWRPEPGFEIQGRSLPKPPSSVSLVLSRSQTAVGGAAASQVSRIAELSIAAGEAVVTGTRTFQVEVKE